MLPWILGCFHLFKLEIFITSFWIKYWPTLLFVHLFSERVVHSATPSQGLLQWSVLKGPELSAPQSSQMSCEILVRTYVLFWYRWEHLRLQWCLVSKVERVLLMEGGTKTCYKGQQLRGTVESVAWETISGSQKIFDSERIWKSMIRVGNNFSSSAILFWRVTKWRLQQLSFIDFIKIVLLWERSW